MAGCGHRKCLVRDYLPSSSSRAFDQKTFLREESPNHLGSDSWMLKGTFATQPKPPSAPAISCLPQMTNPAIFPPPKTPRRRGRGSIHDCGTVGLDVSLLVGASKHIFQRPALPHHTVLFFMSCPASRIKKPFFTLGCRLILAVLAGTSRWKKLCWQAATTLNFNEAFNQELIII